MLTYRQYVMQDSGWWAGGTRITRTFLEILFGFSIEQRKKGKPRPLNRKCAAYNQYDSTWGYMKSKQNWYFCPHKNGSFSERHFKPH
jgi:hypothetical protein